MKKILYIWLALMSLLPVARAAVDPSELLPPEEAFIPTLTVSDTSVQADFQVADGYYLYQSKIVATADTPDVLGAPEYAKGKEKEDEFFGKQEVYYHNAQAKWAINKPQPAYKITLTYQGCADVGVCYPPVETEFAVSGSGVYPAPFAANSGASAFLKKPTADAANKPVAPLSSASVDDGYSHFKLSRDTLGLNLLAFFVAGLALSFTACMYPLLPIVSSIIVGDKKGGKKRAFWLSLIYVQGLAVTYTLVGVLAGTTGALLTVWLQQAWVVLTAAAIMVLLALSMFGVFNLQLPAAVQSYFQNQSSKLSGGKAASVFVMGMLSALIVGPCVAPPLAFALGYIGQTGDALLGGLALYALAMGTGVPLILIGTFGGHILPRAGNWMNGIKYAFGVILLAVAVYLATPFIGYELAAIAYSALMIVPALYLLWHTPKLSGSLKNITAICAALLAMGGVWFAANSFTMGGTTAMHRFLTLHPHDENAVHGQKFNDVAAMKAAMAHALQQDPNAPVLLDFYADWCVSCKEMEAKTFNQANVQAAVPMARLFQIDVTANTPEHQALLKEYGLFGPPGLFVLKADGSRSDALLGYVKAEDFVEWYQQRK
ncbi:protein-disulfide reductase DsbD [Neisseriaceae bacterium B1]